MKKKIKFLIALLVFLMIVFSFFFMGKAPVQDEIVWGMNFSQKHTQALNLDWKETYLALLDDLNIKNVRLIAYWDMVEPQKDQYFFEDLDWQIEEAKKRNADVILTVGMKTPRWPECHIPEWARDNWEEELLKYLEEIVEQHKDEEIVWAWQIENEPFFPFGDCPETSRDLVEKEIDLVKKLDPDKKIVITESGSFSFWFKGAKLGDVVGISLYQEAWFKELKRYVKYHLPGVFYWRKSKIIDFVFEKEIICTELQAEPWGPTLLYDSSLEEQKKTMNLDRFRDIISLAKETGLKEFYFWGGEWWYWMKTKQNDDSIWEETKELINN